MTSRPFTPTEQELADILTGRQAQFCRPVKLPGYPDRAHEFHNPRIIKPGVVEFNWNQLAFSGTFVKCPFGARYDTLWIKEKWLIDCPYGLPEDCSHLDHVYYFYGEPMPDIFPIPWRPAVTMPKWASRHSLNVLKVGVERVAYTWMWVINFEVMK